MHGDPGPGAWRVSYLNPQGKLLDGLIQAMVWTRASVTQHQAGQWLADFNAGDHPGQIPEVLRSVACRLGLLPVYFTAQFLRALRSDQPLCLVADTNAIYHGSFFQALRIRRGAPTTVIIPDQVHMEMQRRREREPKAESSEHPLHESLVATARYNLPLVGTRVIERIRGRLKYVIHHARPPEAMVRYFGSEQGSGAEDESGPVDSAGVNFQRDRLLLEAVRHVPTFLPPDVPVWFVTGDAKLAAQADCEGFRVGFSWKPTQPSRFVVTSPHIDPYTLLPHFVPWQEVVEELVWNLGRVALQRSDEAHRSELRLPEVRDRIRAQHGAAWPDSIARRVASPIWTAARRAAAATQEPAQNRRTSGAAQSEGAITPEAPGTEVSRRAPAAQSLVSALLEAATADGVLLDKVPTRVRPYLTALKWALQREGRFHATDRGTQLATAWATLSRTTVTQHADWLAEACRDLLQLGPVRAVRDALQGKMKITGEALALLLGWEAKDVKEVHALARLLASFGTIVRVAGACWGARAVGTEEAEAVVLQATRALLAERQRSGVIGVDQLYARLLVDDPLSLVNFRLALWGLYQQGVIRPGGSAPVTGQDTIKVELLIPDATSTPMVEAIDLGAGDFLLPGVSSQTLSLEARS